MIASLADEQLGLVTRRQLAAAVVTDDAIRVRLRDGRLRPLHRGVYAAGHRHLTREALLLAAVLACGPGAVASHRSAGVLWEVRDASRSSVDVTTRSSSRSRNPGIDRHTTRRLAADEVTVRRGVPVTTVERTLADLACLVGVDDLRRTMERADSRYGIDVPRLERSARGRAGAPVIRKILADWSPAPTHRGLEECLLALVQRSGLPEPRVNWPLCGLEVDLLWPRARLVVEADSRAFHGTAAAFERDRHRDAVLAAQGHRVLRFTWLQVTRAPAEVVAAIRQALVDGSS